MRLKIFLLPLLMSSSLAIAAPGTSRIVPDANLPASGVKKSVLDADLFYQILLGEFSANAQDPQTAFAALLDAAQKTKEPALFRRAVQIALQTRSWHLALRAAKDWSRLIPESREANRFVLEILLGINRVTEVQDVLEREVALAPAEERRQIIWSWPSKFAHAGERMEAAVVVRRALDKWLTDTHLGASAWAVVGRLWQQAGDTDRAIDAATKGLALDGKSEHAALLALFLMDLQIPQAETLVKKYLPYTSAYFRLGYVKALFRNERQQDARRELKIIHKLYPIYPDAWLFEAAMDAQDGLLDVAQQQLERYIGLTDKLPAAKQTEDVKRARVQTFFFLAQLATRGKNFAAARAWLDRIDSPEDELQVRFRRADLMAEQGRVDQAVALIQDGPEKSADDARLKRLAEVQLLRQQKLFERARDRLRQLMTQFPGDLDLVYVMALTYERLGDLQQMEQLLRRLIAARPNDADAYNALGYSLADHNMRLSEAILLIKKALELSPNNPLIMDSLAWVEFRRGNANQALKLLRNVFKVQSDAEIAAHLGEVLWSLNQRSEALQIFRDALKINPDNETLKETIERLRIEL